MKVIWDLDKATVRDVYETLRKRRQVAYTTVMTMMKILEDKGYLKKTRVDRAHVYTPRVRGSRWCGRWYATSWSACSMALRVRCCCSSPRMAA